MMKNMNLKTLLLVWSVWFGSCVWLRESTINTQSQIAHLWSEVRTTPIDEDHIIQSYCDDSRQVSHQDLPNSCSIADMQMIINHYADTQYTEWEITQMYHNEHRRAALTSQHLFKWQNPHIGSMARFLNHHLSDYDANISKQTLTPEFLTKLCASWWSVLISIHSSLWYPHRVVVVGYREDNESWYVQFINPSWITTNKDWDTIVYRNHTQNLDSLTINNQARIDECKLLDFNLLHIYTTFKAKFPIYLVEKPSYIVIQPKNKSEDSSPR